MVPGIRKGTWARGIGGGSGRRNRVYIVGVYLLLVIIRFLCQWWHPVVLLEGAREGGQENEVAMEKGETLVGGERKSEPYTILWALLP